MFIDADDAHPVEAAGVGGDDHAGGVEGDGVDGVPGQAQLPCYCGDGGAVDHQPAQDVAGAPPRGRGARACELGGVVGEHFPRTISRGAAVARHPDAQPQRMPHHRHIGHLADHGVAIDTLTTTPGTAAPDTVVEQIAEHHRDLAVDGGVGDRHP